MKQSVGLVFLQFVSLSIGFVTSFWVASNISSEVYAIVGIYYVISSFMIVFSNTGIETYASRNILNWIEIKDIDNIKIIVNQSIVLRFILSSLLVIPMVLYSLYISTTKFNGEHMSLLVIMCVSCVFYALNDSMILLLKSFNKYLIAATARYTITVFGKILALIAFLLYGFEYYIYTLILLPFIVSIPIMFILRKWLTIRSIFSANKMIENIIKSKYFALSSYLSYIYGYLDQLLISVFMDPEIIGSYTLAKNFLNIAKQFVENIFDNLIQELVRYKYKLKILDLKLNKITKTRNIILFFSLALFPILVLIINKSINFIGLSHYKHLNIFVISIYISQIMYVAMKIKYNYITLFFSEIQYLKLSVLYAVISITAFIILISIHIKYVFLYLFFTNCFMLFYTNKLFKKESTLNYKI